MRLRPQPITVDASDPFAADLLGRRPVADSLTELARSAQEGLVVSLHGQWGSGKTTFLSMWRHHLRAAGFRTLTFNAWETDIADDAMVALLGELEIGLAATTSSSETTPTALQTSVKKAKKIGSKLLRSAIPTAIRVATAGALDLEDLSEEVISEWTGKLAEEQVAAYESARKSVQSFRESISAIARAANEDGERGGTLPLVFIIDELDRCRPSYAVRVLECVKHFFAVPGVMFVLAVDAEQLAHAVKSQYGQSMDAPGYLRRFFDLELTLPEPTENQFSRAQFRRFDLEKVFEERRAYSSVGHEMENIIETFDDLFSIFRCSLRDRERCFTLLSFALRSTSKNYPLHPIVLTTLIVLKIKEPSTYANVSQGKGTAEDILRALRSRSGGSAFLETRLGQWVHVCLYSVFSGRHEISDVVLRLQQEADANDNESTKEKTKSLISMLQRRESRDMSGSLDYLLGKIDLVASKG